MASDLGQWLCSIGLGDYVESFAAQRITWDVMSDLSEQDLKELGLPLGDRKRLLKAIVTLRESAEASAGTELFLPPASQGRDAERRNHTAGIAATDFLIVPTIGFRLLFVLVILRH